MKHRIDRPIICFALIGTLVAGGCTVSNGRAQYTMLTTHQLSPGRPSANLSMAFGLDRDAATTPTIAHAEPR